MARQKPSIITFPPFLMASVAFLFMCALAGFWAANELADLKRQSTSARQEYVAERKEFLRAIVDEVVSFVEFDRAHTEQRVRINIRSRVEEAHAIATHIIETFGPTRSRKELEDMVREALRPIRFNDGRGYFFAFNLDGVEQLFADRPELEGTDMLGLQGAKGEYVVRDMIDLVREQGEGYYSYTWTKPGEPRDTHFEKIAYVKVIEPMGWVVGTGEYVKDMEDDIKQEVLVRLSEITPMQNEYVFAGTWEGITLVGPRKGMNSIEVTDVNGVKIVQELVDKAKRGGGFVEYVIPKFGGGRSAPKLSYVAGVPDWQWYVGVGTFVDDIEKQIGVMETQFRNRLYKKLGTALTLVLLGAIGVFLVARRLSQNMDASFNAFLSFFERSRKGDASIDVDKLAFREFATIADAANQMIASKTADLREAKEGADYANRAKTDFLAHMSHELRTPLNAILGFSSAIQENIFGPLNNAKYTEYVDSIHESGRHLLELINDILDLSKVEAHALELDEEQVDLNALIVSALRLVEQRAQYGKVKVVSDVQGDLPKLICDERRMKQILVNLLSNAVKFTPPDGEVHVNWRQDPAGRLAIVVKDNGIGMDGEELNVVFSPFGQIKNPLSRSSEGTGLGLPLTKALVDLHGGELNIESQKEVGTTVEVWMPQSRIVT